LYYLPREGVRELHLGLARSLTFMPYSWIVWSMSRGTRIALSLMVSVLVLAGIFAGVRLWNVHQQTSDWVLSPKEVPSRVQFADREYNCGPNPQPAEHDVSALTSQGRTAGGGEIFAQEPSAEARVFIVVQTGKGAFGCGLMGGP